MSARSGMGKTTLLTRLITEARKDEAFKETRFVYVSVKAEHLFKDKKIKPVASIDKALKNMRKNPITVFYPMQPEFYEDDVDQLIDSIFHLSDANPEASFTIIIDDANILKGFDNRGIPSQQIKKLAVAGRSKRIRGMFITHRLGNLPRIMNGQLSSLIVMSVNTMDLDYAKKIFGMDFEPLSMELFDFKWAVVDLIDEKTYRFNPVEPV
tara:strand:+ start:2836 stop:3465 length:630 start_codon:yes stop_codon:yes gene_type:complete